jgi:hypothetical protein
VKPSTVFFIAPDLLISLGKRFRRQLSPTSGMWAAIYTKPATDESVPASVITAPIAMPDKNAGSILSSKDTLGGGHVVCKRSFRLLDDADVVSVLGENVVNTFPARTVSPGTVDQNDIPNAMLLVLR